MAKKKTVSPKPKRVKFGLVVRDSDEDSPRPDLISPFALERLGKWLADGAKKYFPRGWEGGMEVSRCNSSLSRHLMYFQQDKTDEDHLAAIMCNAMMIIHTKEMIKRGVLPECLDDMPDYNKPKKAVKKVAAKKATGKKAAKRQR